ncbi:MAG: extracellular solute-binding protein [Oscillospiraceae bacterium]
MKKTTRILALALCAALFMGALAGCGKEVGGPKDPVAVTVWHYYNGAQQEDFDALVEEFNQSVGTEKGIVVSAKSYGTVYELTENVTDAVNGKVGAEDAPDIFAAYADTAYEIHEKGLAVNLADYLTEEEQQAYVPAYLDEGRFGAEGFRIFPVAKSGELLSLNKTSWDQFSAATGATEAGLTTWEGIADIAKQYYEWTDSLTPEVQNDGKAFFGRDAFANYMVVGSYQLGHSIFNVTDGKMTLDLDRETLRRLWDNYYTPYISGYYAAFGKFRSDDVRTGDIASFVGATSGATYFPKEVTLADGTTYPIEGKVYPLPNFKDTQPVCVQQGAGMVVMKSTHDREQAAVEFLKWFTEPKQNLRFASGSGYLPVTLAASQPEAILESLTAQGTHLYPVLEDSIKLGVEMCGTYTLYTTPPFENGYAARVVADKSMEKKAEADRVVVQQLLAEGMTLADAVAAVNTDENFNAWCGDFQTALEEALKG